MSDGDDDPITRSDHLRATPAPAGQAPGFKEWSYFCIATPDVDLLLTFTFLGRIDLPAVDAWPPARVLALARTRTGRWSGGVDEIPPDAVRATPGRVDMTMGACELRFTAGAYALDARLASSAIEVHLRLRPLAPPAVGTSVRMGNADPMRWIVVPRLEAHGELLLDRRRTEVVGGRAYHDHNWGAFSWGGDFAWEWGLVLPSETHLPWTVVYSRISDRARQRVLSQAILVWRDDLYCRAFRDDEITVEESGLLRGGARLRVPRVMSLVEPATTADVPRTLLARARGGGDRLELRLAPLDFAEVAVPNETHELGTTLLCEARAEAQVTGVIRGERFSLVAPAILEMNHGAARPLPPPPRDLRPVR
jgi:hypothetical protein